MLDYPVIRQYTGESPIYQPFAHIQPQKSYRYDLPPLNDDEVQELDFEDSELTR